MNEQNKEYYTIDLIHIMKTLWKKAWIIVITVFLTGAMGFGTAAFLVTPQYSSSVMLYVNNSSLSLGGFDIGISDINAAQELVKTYSILLKNRTTLEKVIEKAGVDYEYKELYDMIEAKSVNGTEILGITVTSPNPYDSANIANTICEVLPIRISEIVDGATVEVVDYAIVDLQKVSPSVTTYTFIGILIGALISCGAISVHAILDDKIYSEDYILKTYGYPILAKIPELTQKGSKYGSKYYYYKKKSYYQAETEE